MQVKSNGEILSQVISSQVYIKQVVEFGYEFFLFVYQSSFEAYGFTVLLR